MRSSTLLPRSRVGACSPSTHRIASTTFDLPHPLGPTTAVIPGAKPIVVESRKDLKPSSSRLLRRMLPSPPPHHHLPKVYPKVPSEGQEHPQHIVCRGTADPANCGFRSLAREAGIKKVKSWTLILDKLGIPVSAIDLRQVRHPFPVPPKAEHLGRKRSPLGASRPAEQMHPGFVGRAATLAAIAVMARAYDVLPRGHPATRARNDMVQVELGARQFLVAILAGVAVAGEDVEARESHVALGHALVRGQQQDPRHADEAVHYPQPLMLNFDRQVAPTVEVEGVILLIDGLRNALIKQIGR